MIGIDAEEGENVFADRSRVRAEVFVEMDAELLAWEMSEESLEVRSVVAGVHHDAQPIVPTELKSDVFGEGPKRIRPAHRKILGEKPVRRITKHHDEPRVGKLLANRAGSSRRPPVADASFPNRALLAHTAEQRLVMRPLEREAVPGQA